MISRYLLHKKVILPDIIGIIEIITLWGLVDGTCNTIIVD
jgi:hypothetical protein